MKSSKRDRERGRIKICSQCVNLVVIGLRTGAQGDVLWASMAAKYEREAARAWDAFYKRNGANFFKDRHYVDTVFEELRASPGADG